MNERFAKTKNDIQAFWSSRSKKQKTTYGASLIAVIIIAATITFFLSRTEYVPLYTDVSIAEIGRIKEQLDMLGVQSQIAPGGTSILVPKERVDDLLVTLAAEGYPSTGTIDYSFFSNNAGFGMTDNEFNVIKLASMQTELANLMKGIEGVKDAKVMLTLPSENVFLNDHNQRASAAIILNTNPGHQFNESQINALYNLVSKSIPNLSKEDIEITNQYFEYFDLKTEKEQFGTSIADQIAVKKSIERDLQRQVQMMLGTMMGQDKVIVSVTTDIDFKLENREESLVTPVDEESMEGIALSVQRITESFTGNTPVVGGEPPMDDPTDNNTSIGEFAGSNGDYERIEETVNHEVNRIRKEIVESPYKIRDIGIQVMVEPPVAEDMASMPVGLQDDIEQILATIIRTSIDKEAAGELTNNEINERIVVSVQPFNGKVTAFDAPSVKVPLWIYIVGGALLLIIIVLVILFVRNRRAAEEAEVEEVIEGQEKVLHVEDINEEQETEGTLRRKQLEKMAKEKPEEFAKLLRTWIAED
ncbi:flagellar basal-body MS-ring/collar protein FliF [Sporosarcina ureilytica]|uniref:Flagellar M-ring protein n=1 Tax=Sporosarcina ureilytica TaxID=298596 RepID=A0A1D8JHS4_9BACL|nr:flagellar basal-body MS-ring/collar protein FliF [Sporosarcina ureilytica]AOV08272.1 flagellar M-ring protein FliF [Sporosarcina ureilytica]